MTPQFPVPEFPLSDRQLEVYQSTARFRILVAGRRFGKTHLALVEMIMAAQKPGSLIWYLGPNHGQSKTIAWERLKELSRPFWASKPNESELRIDLIWGSTIFVKGGFVPDSHRGVGLDFVVIDEAANIKPELWHKTIRPALADRQGRALFIGTPQGRNHFYDLYEQALRDPDWAAFQFTTLQGGIVNQQELDSVARDMDHETFRQEMEGAFINVGLHQVYRAFDKATNVKPQFVDDMSPLVWALDFNIDPLCMLIMQKVGEEVRVLEEIVMKDSCTELACERFFERADIYYRQTHSSQRPLVIKIYGDASGNNRSTAGSRTDWQIVKNSFNHWRGTYKDEYYIPSANPPVRDRVNCLNARLRNQTGDSRLFIDPKCLELIRDLEEVSWCVDSTGSPVFEINKASKLRTHTSDALGYFIAQAFPMRSSIGHKGDGPIL